MKVLIAAVIGTCTCVAAASDQAAPAAASDGSLYLVRLTPTQYERSIRDIFGASIQIDVNKSAPGFRDEGLLALGSRRLTITSAEMQQYEKLAQDVANQVVQPNRRATLLGCKPVSEQVADEKCASAFLQKVGLYLFRRPLTADELQTFVATHTQAAQRLGSFNAGVRAALARMLVTPEFLFRVELSEPDQGRPGTQRLDAYSTASRLSFFLWDSVPDAELFAAAESGKLMTQAGVEQQVQRMLLSPRVEGGLRAFFSDMLGFDGFATLAVDSTLYPKFTKNVLEDADEQTLRTIVEQLLVRNNTYGDLFTTRETFLTPSLAALYGVPLPRSQEMGGAVPWVPYTFAAGDPRVGILSHASFLSLNSHPGTTSPTLRGKAVREKLLCQKVPPPPGNVDFSIVQDLNNPNFKTARQRLTAHSTEAMCAGCHKITDPMGLALEQFDTASGFRTKERGEPIDASGNLNGKPFNGIAELAQVLKDQPSTTACVINRAYSYGTQRKPTAEERKWLTELQAQLNKDGGVRWRDLAHRVTVGPDFFTVPAATTQAAPQATAQAE